MLLYLMPFSASVVVKEAERHDDDADAVYDASGTPDKSSLVSVTGSSTESSSSSSDDDSGIEFVSNSYIFIIFFLFPGSKRQQYHTKSQKIQQFVRAPNAPNA